MVLPFGYENLPFKPNALRAISALQDGGYAERMSILLFDNEKLSQQYLKNEKIDSQTTIATTSLEDVNGHIIGSTSLVLDMINVYHDPTKFSPFTIDEIEHESVIFSYGFIGVDSRVYDGEEADVKFDYGKISSAKNVIIAKAVSPKESDYTIKSTSGLFLEKVRAISKKAKSARIMYGIIRTDRIENGTFVIIANNLDVGRYMNKVKNKVGSNIENFLTKDDHEKILTNREKNLFDI